MSNTATAERGQWIESGGAAAQSRALEGVTCIGERWRGWTRDDARTMMAEIRANIPRAELRTTDPSGVELHLLMAPSGLTVGNERTTIYEARLEAYGNTYPHRGALKKGGFRWDPVSETWSKSVTNPVSYARKMREVDTTWGPRLRVAEHPVDSP